MDATPMRIWVDADACPRVIKDILYRAADRRKVRLILVANSRFPVPKSEFIDFMQVGAGFDKADLAIVEQARDGDLVITTDIPLASGVIEKAGLGLSPRGELFTPDNIRSRLTMRDFMDEMRGSGVMTGGRRPLAPGTGRSFPISWTGCLPDVGTEQTGSDGRNGRHGPSGQVQPDRRSALVQEVAQLGHGAARAFGQGLQGLELGPGVAVPSDDGFLGGHIAPGRRPCGCDAGQHGAGRLGHAQSQGHGLGEGQVANPGQIPGPAQHLQKPPGPVFLHHSGQEKHIQRPGIEQDSVKTPPISSPVR